MNALVEYDELVSLANNSFSLNSQLQTENESLKNENALLGEECKNTRAKIIDMENALHILKEERARENRVVKESLQKLVDATRIEPMLSAAQKENAILRGRIKSIENQLQFMNSEIEGLQKTIQLQSRETAIIKASFEEEKKELLATIERLKK